MPIWKTSAIDIAERSLSQRGGGGTSASDIAEVLVAAASAIDIAEGRRPHLRDRHRKGVGGNRLRDRYRRGAVAAPSRESEGGT